jgi:hypothetical protein
MAMSGTDSDGRQLLQSEEIEKKLLAAKDSAQKTKDASPENHAEMV